MSPKQKKAGRAPKRPAVADAKVVGVWFPVAYLKVIANEAARFGVGRGHFLTMLVKRKQGEIIMERPQNAPAYEATEDELTQTQKYVWAMTPQVRAQIDAARLPMGNINVGTYLLLLVNEWLGQPRGLKIGDTPQFGLEESPTGTAPVSREKRRRG